MGNARYVKAQYVKEISIEMVGLQLKQQLHPALCALPPFAKAAPASSSERSATVQGTLHTVGAQQISVDLRINSLTCLQSESFCFTWLPEAASHTPETCSWVECGPQTSQFHSTWSVPMSPA